VNVADQRVHGTTHEKPQERFLRSEIMIPVDLRPPAPRERVVIRRVPADCYVAVETNRYPVPFTWVGRDIEVQLLAAEVVLRSAGDDPVRHVRLDGSHQVARWRGAPRRLVTGQRSSAGPPRLDPVHAATLGDVEVRSLLRYEEVAR
jgi:hypothetical protein